MIEQQTWTNSKRESMPARLAFRPCITCGPVGTVSMIRRWAMGTMLSSNGR